VLDYNNQNIASNTEMARNGAVVRIYSQNRLLQTFRIPSNGVGPKWNVFRIERGNLVPVNTVTAR
jgi:hypothetical protein